MKNVTIGILVVVIALLAWFVIAPPVFIQNLMGQATTTPEVINGGNTETPSNNTNDGLTRAGGNDNARALAARVDIDAPGLGDPVFKNFTVTGKAPGPWFFEASFPVEVRNPQGAVVGTGIATALTEWMTENDVAFKADVTISGNYSGPATLVLIRDNPSGLPEHAGSVSMPITIQAQ